VSEIELNACPFCGGVAHLYNYLEEAGAECLECHAKILRSHDKFCSGSGMQVAATAWNTRTSQWQPIESAPKDGTEILAWDGQGQATIHWSDGRWSLVYAGWRAEDGDFDGAISWQALPAAPGVDG